nr:MAG: capsid protein [Cressdnaviricota sp.]
MPRKSSSVPHASMAGIASAVARLITKSYPKANHKVTNKLKTKSPTKSHGTWTKKKSPSNTVGLGSIRPGVTFSHGRRSKLSPKFIKKCREAVSNVDTYLFKQSIAQTSAIGQCTYSFTAPLFSTLDVEGMNTHTSGGVPTTKFLVKDATQQVMLANMTSVAAYIRIYECKPRQVIPLTAGIGSLPALLAAGFTDSGDTPAIQDIAGTAFQSSSFTAWVKVLKVRNLVLQPGENMTVYLKVNNPTLVNMETMFPGSATNVIVPRQARFFLFQQWGGIVNDSVLTNNVSTGSTKVDFAITSRYNYQWSSDYDSNVYTSGTFATVTTGELMTTSYNGVASETIA